MIDDRKIGAWSNPIVGEADRPNRSAADMKSIFDSNSNELKTAINGVIDDIGDGAFSVAFIEAMAAAQISPSDDMATILGKLAAFFTAAQTAITTVQIDEDHPNRYLSADGTYKTPSAGEAVNGLPEGGTSGQMLIKSTSTDYDSAWGTVTPQLIGAAELITDGNLVPAASWTASGSGYEITINYQNVLSTDTVIVNPSPESFDAYAAAGVRATTVTDGYIRFFANAVPDDDLTVNVLALR